MSMLEEKLKGLISVLDKAQQERDFDTIHHVTELLARQLPKINQSKYPEVIKALKHSYTLAHQMVTEEKENLGEKMGVFNKNKTRTLAYSKVQLATQRG